ncbi:hypothetical protein F2Q70_00008826 [Brassica cretica]|uniref:Uncharacterized protein n=1 Tax=Brassica cretica TaxID=69181 RepID=A0A8S9M2W0_BRACR|nr:hypothetical protein F2Q70_00008826 [Brassica cretica]
MSEELPKRLFKEGEEPRVTQINNNCRIDYIIRKFQAWLPKELDVVKKDPVFHQIFKLHENGLGYSARVIHSFLYIISKILETLDYLDNLSKRELLTEQGDTITFESEMDQTYLGSFWNFVYLELPDTCGILLDNPQVIAKSFEVTELPNIFSKILETLDYLDNLSKRELLTEQGDTITFESEMDQTYLGSSS